MKRSKKSFAVFKCLVTSLAAAVCITAAPLRAQFSGPALGSDATVNRPVTITTDPAILYPPDREIVIAPGDQLSVHIFSVPEFSPVVRVSLDGTVSLPYIGLLQVTDLTTPQVEKKIRSRLIAAGIYVDPQVEVQLMESQNHTITITGEVHAVIPLLGKRRLLDVLTAAGGVPSTASHVITIDRQGLDTPIAVDLGNDPAKSSLANIPVFAGDTIIVARTGVVYALGAFRVQSMIPLTGNSPLTVMQAMAIAGGANFEGKREDARIVRTEGTHRVMVKVNMGRVLSGKDPDPVLKSDDILYLPTSPIKAAIRAGGIATLMGIAQLTSYITLR